MKPTPDIPQPPAEREWSDADLAQIGRQLAFLYLHVERGYTPRRRLERYLSTDALLTQRDPHITRHPGPPPSWTDVTQVRVSRPPGGRVAHLTVLTRVGSDRQRALLLRLAITDHRLLVTELIRPEDRHLLLGEARRPPQHENLDATYNALLVTHRLASEALHAATRAAGGDGNLQLALYGDNDPALMGVDRWRRILEDLDHQLEHVAGRLKGRNLAATRAAAATVLGERPDNPRAALEWDHAVDALGDYRVRYNLTGSSPLGPPIRREDNPLRATARAAAAARLDAARATITDLTTTRDRTPLDIDL